MKKKLIAAMSATTIVALFATSPLAFSSEPVLFSDFLDTKDYSHVKSDTLQSTQFLLAQEERKKGNASGFVELLTKAADKGHKESCEQLVQLYTHTYKNLDENGKLVKKYKKCKK